MKKGEIKRGLISLILTSIIILTLILMTPANAVEVSITTDKAAYKIKDVVTFNFKVDMNSGEKVPIQYLTLKLNGIEKCRFKPTGEIISGCQNMIITNIETKDYGYGYMQGTGFGHDGTTGTEQTFFGYGYGYGYGYSETEQTPLQYEIKWTTTDNDFGNYDAVLEAFAQNGDKQFTYISGAAPFLIRRGVLATEAKASITANDGEATIKGTTYEGSSRDNVEFFGDIRAVNAQPGGTIAVNADLYKEDGTHTMFTVRMKPKILDDFNRDRIEVEGLAQIEIKTTKKGAKNIKILDEVHVVAVVDINHRTVTVSSDDAQNPFIVENMKIKSNGFDYREYQKIQSTRKGIPVQLLEVFRLSF